MPFSLQRALSPGVQRNIWSDIDEPLERRHIERLFNDEITNLHGLGLVVAGGSWCSNVQCGLPMATPNVLPTTTIYVVVSPKEHPKRFVLQDRSASFRI